jgi:hypothetical protein
MFSEDQNQRIFRKILLEVSVLVNLVTFFTITNIFCRVMIVVVVVIFVTILFSCTLFFNIYRILKYIQQFMKIILIPQVILVVN